MPAAGRHGEAISGAARRQKNKGLAAIMLAVGPTAFPSIQHLSPVGKRMDTAAALPYNRHEMVRREGNPRANRAWDIFMAGVGALSSIPLERMVFSRRRSSQGEGPSSPTSSAKSTRPAAWARTIETAGTEETIAWQRRQIAKELYSLQKNLAAGAMIEGKPCDCIADKHCLGLEALAEETMAMHRDSIYQEMLDWNKDVAAKGTHEAIASGRYGDDYQRMAQEARAFRKRLMGTEEPGAMLTQQERREILARARTVALENVDTVFENQLGPDKDSQVEE